MKLVLFNLFGFKVYSYGLMIGIGIIVAVMILNFNMKYYKNYSCNDIKSNIERTYLLKKYLN